MKMRKFILANLWKTKTTSVSRKRDSGNFPSSQRRVDATSKNYCEASFVGAPFMELPGIV
jgi:hypothetical protein